MPIQLLSSGLPYARIKVTTGTLILGGGDGEKSEVAILGLQLAVDPENSIPGWLRIIDKDRDFVAGQHGKPQPLRPTADHIWTVSMPLRVEGISDTIFNIADTSVSYLGLAQRLYNATERGFGQGKIPVIRITGTGPRKTARGSSIDIAFQVDQWIDRPGAFLEAIEARDASLVNIKPTQSYAEASGKDVAPLSDFGDTIPF